MRASRYPLSLALPRRFLRGGYGRLALAIVALTAGVALVCAMDMVSRAVLSAFTEVLDTAAGRAALMVTAGGAPVAEDVADSLKDVPGVELAVPVVIATAFAADGSGDLVTVYGVDVANDSAVRVYDARGEDGLDVEDPLVFISQPDSIVLTREFASARRLTVGDRLDLLTPNGKRTFTLRALLEPEGIGRAYGGSLAIMDLPAAEVAFLTPGMVSRVDVVVRRDASLEAVRAAIERSLAPGLRVETPGQRKADLHRAMQSLQVMLQAVSLLGLAAAFLIILNRLGTLFETRAWQLGVLRAVGMRAGRLRWELAKESLLLGAIGVALGIPLGIAVGRLLVPVVATTAALNFKLVATDVNLRLRPESMAIAALLGLGTSWLAAALPARRLSRRSPIEAIRGRGLTTPQAREKSSRASVVVLVLLALAVVGQIATHAAAWGLAATGLAAIGAALLARPLLRALAPPLLNLLRAIAGPSAHLARSSLERDSGRAVLTVAMIGVGIGAIIWLRILAYSFEASLVHALSGALQGDWVVTSAHVTHGYLESPVDGRLTEEIAALDGVQGAIGERLVDWQHQGGEIAIDAFDPEYFTSSAFGRWPLIGSSSASVWSELAAGRAVLVSSSFAVNLGARAGDDLEIATPQGALRLPIAGITVNFSSPRGTVVMSRALYAAHWGDPQINRVFVRVTPDGPGSSARSLIAERLGPKYGLRIISASELIEYFATQVRRAFAPLDVLAGLLLFVLLIGLADTLAASVLERTRDLAVLRALGARRALLRRAVIVEALGIGIPGLGLALGLGLLLGVVWVRETFPSLLGWSLETHLPAAQIAIVSVATLGVCWLAGALPARRAAALEPALALRTE